jgi:hypothetical protein
VDRRLRLGFQDVRLRWKEHPPDSTARETPGRPRHVRPP